MLWLTLAYSLACLPLAFWWCCCRGNVSCPLSCCRSNTPPGTSSSKGWEFIFTSFPTDPFYGPIVGCGAGSCEAFYEGVSIIIDVYDESILGECTWQGLGAILTCGGSPVGRELPKIRVSTECSSDRKALTIAIGATSFGGNFVNGARLTIASATAGDVICNTLTAGTLTTTGLNPSVCDYDGATFTIQAIP